MIILITYLEEKTNTRMVSHGYDVNTDQIVVLPNVPLVYFNHRYDSESGEWILK